MGSLIHTIDNVAAALWGINILEQAPAAAVQGAATTAVGTVADLPWGPVDEVITIGGPAELASTFFPSVFGRLDVAFPALYALIGKTFPSSLKVVRIAATGQAISTFTFQDIGPADSVKVDARHPGLVGDSIQVEWIANADDPTSRDMRVKVGAYDVTYLAVVTAAGGQTIVDPGDSFAVVTGVGTAVPIAIGLTSLAGGLDGTAALGDYLGDPGVPPGRGLELYADQGVAVDVVFGAEIPQALVAGWNTGLKAWQDAYEKHFAVLSTDSSIITASAAITDVAARRKDRLSMHYPRVQQTNTFDPDRGVVVVDGNAFAAVAIASVPTENSPGGTPGAPFLKGILGLDPGFQTLTSNNYKSLNDAGIAPFFMSTPHQGAIIHAGYTTSLVPAEIRIFRRRHTDFIQDSLADFAQLSVGKLLDLDLPNKILGANTGDQVASWTQFLQDLVDSNPSRLREYGIDPFGGNLQSNIDDGVWIAIVQAKLFSAQEKTIFVTEIGEGVTITVVQAA